MIEEDERKTYQENLGNSHHNEKRLSTAVVDVQILTATE